MKKQILFAVAAISALFLNMYVGAFAKDATTATANTVASAVEYGERTPDKKVGPYYYALNGVSVNSWVNISGKLCLYLEAYGINRHSNQTRFGYPFVPGFPNNSDCPCSAAVVSFNNPVVLGRQPFIAFEVRYNISGQVPGTSTKPFMRVQYADGDYVTIPTSSFTDKYLGDGWYQHVLTQPFPFSNYAVQRIAVLGRPDSIQGAHCWVRNIQISPSGSVPIPISQLMQNLVRGDDPLISFVYP